MPPSQRHPHARYFPSGVDHPELRRVIRPLDVAGEPIHLRRQTKGLHPAKCLRGAGHHFRALAPGDHSSSARHQVHEPPELQRNRRKVSINIGVLVFIALDDEVAAAAQSVAALTEIRQHPAHQKIRTPAGRLKNPRQHRSGGGLPVRSGDHDRVVARNKKLLDDLGHRAVWDLGVEDVFEFGIPTRDDISNHR